MNSCLCFGDIGWYSTIAPKEIVGPLTGSPKRLSCGVFSACDLRVLGSPIPIRVHPGASTFPSALMLQSHQQLAHPLHTDTFSVPTITDGYARTRQGKTITFALTWAWLYIWAVSLLKIAAEHDRLVTQSTATPKPGCPGHRLECVTTPGSRRSCPGWAAAQHLKIYRFHQPCLLPWRTSLTATETRLAGGQGQGEDCRPRTSPVFPPVRLTGGTYHADGTTAGRVISPFLLSACATPVTSVFAHTHFLDLAGPPPPVRPGHQPLSSHQTFLLVAELPSRRRSFSLSGSEWKYDVSSTSWPLS